MQGDVVPTIDELMGGPGGRAFDDLARRFGLDRGQIDAAVAALMPAFAEAMRRSVADPAAAASLMQAWQKSVLGGLAAGGSTDAAAAMFGNEAMRAAVAEQAARASGLSGETMRTLLPPLAATFMGNLARAFAHGLNPPPAAAAGAAAADAMAAAATAFTEFMKGIAPPSSDAAAEAPKAAAPGPDAADPLKLAQALAERQTEAMKSVFDAFLAPKKPGG
jgi:hypothetical protein